jgi:hypothetical protein
MAGPVMDSVVPTADVPPGPAPGATQPDKTAEAVAALAAGRAQMQAQPAEPGQPAAL